MECKSGKKESTVMIRFSAPHSNNHLLSNKRPLYLSLLISAPILISAPVD